MSNCGAHLIGKPIPVVDVNSVGGLVQEKLGRLPRQGERIRFPDFEIEVLEMVGPRIELVRVRPLESAISDDVSHWSSAAWQSRAAGALVVVAMVSIREMRVLMA